MVTKSFENRNSSCSQLEGSACTQSTFIFFLLSWVGRGGSGGRGREREKKYYTTCKALSTCIGMQSNCPNEQSHSTCIGRGRDENLVRGMRVATLFWVVCFVQDGDVLQEKFIAGSYMKDF
jgi:hypothetical protein